MSRVGKKVVNIPAKTSVACKGRELEVKGEKGTLKRTIHPAVELAIEGDTISVKIDQEDRKTFETQCVFAVTKPCRALHRQCFFLGQPCPSLPLGRLT
jgi:large subunit ribosomal protein L6